MQEVYRNITDNDWMLYVFMFSFLLLAVTRALFHGRINHHVSGLFKGSPSILSITRSSFFSSYRMLVTLTYCVSLSIAVYLCVDGMPLTDGFDNRLLLLFDIFLLFLLYQAIKLQIKNFFAWILHVEDWNIIYSQMNLAQQVMFCFIMLPTLFILYYSGLWESFLDVYTLLALVVICYTFNILIFFRFFGFKSKLFLFFIFYLCTIEFSPLIAAFKMLLSADN